MNTFFSFLSLSLEVISNEAKFHFERSGLAPTVTLFERKYLQNYEADRNEIITI